MRPNDKILQKLANLIISDLKSQNLIQFKVSEDKVIQRALALLVEDFSREKALDEEVNRMLDDLERKDPGSFQRYKMFPLLKKKLAQQKGIVL
jgi:hypothetical protein